MSATEVFPVQDKIKSLKLLDVIGWALIVIGLLLLIYSFFSARGFTMGLYIIDDTFIIRIVFLIVMAFIGWYVFDKGSLLTGVNRARSVIVLAIGVILLIFTFFTANVFIIALYDANAINIIRMGFLAIMVAIGVVLTRQGIKDLQSIYNIGDRKIAVKKPIENEDLVLKTENVKSEPEKIEVKKTDENDDGKSKKIDIIWDGKDINKR